MPDRMDKSKTRFPANTGVKDGAAKAQHPHPYGRAASNVPSVPYGRTASNAPSVYNPYGQRRTEVPKAPPVQTIPLTPKEQKQLQRAQRRNKNYFFVMRRGVCFAIFVCMLLYVAALALSFINISPVNGFVSLFTIPDNTDQEKRWEIEEEIDENGLYVVYNDTSSYIGANDPIMGFIRVITGMLSPAQQEAVADEVDTEDETDTEAGGQEGTETDASEEEVSYYDRYLKLMEDRQSDFDVLYKVAYNVFKYFPAAMLAGAITALIAMLTSFGAARGRRLYGGFGIAALIMLVAGVAALAAGLMLSNVLQASMAGPLDTANLQSYLLRAIMGPPLSAADALASPPLQLVTGYLMWAMLILPIPILLLSPFTRKKVSYKIFNK